MKNKIKPVQIGKVKISIILAISLFLLGGFFVYFVTAESSDSSNEGRISSKIKWAVNYEDREYLDPAWLSPFEIPETVEGKLRDKNYQKYLRENNSFRLKKDNYYKSYNSSEKRLIIENSEFDKLIDLKLESDYIEAVISKKSALSAWFNLKDFSGENFVDTIRFYDANNDYNEITKNYSFKYKLNNPIINCSDDKKICFTKEWEEFNNLSELPNKNIEIGLFIDVESGDKFEWVIEKDGFEILEWALVLGTNYGFVTTAPTANPTASGLSTDWYARAVIDTSSLTAGTITEMGWFSSTEANPQADYEVGLYVDEGNDEPEQRLYVSTGHTTQENTSKWNVVSGLNWEISPNTTYWLAFQVDNTDPLTAIDFYSSGGPGVADKYVQNSLPINFYTANKRPGWRLALYAVVAEDTNSPTYSNIQSNSTIVGQSTSFSILWDDGTGLDPNGQYIFSTNNTGAWVNESVINFTATPSWANVTKTLNSTEGISIGYRWYVDDNAGNINNTGIFTLTTTSADTCTCPGLATSWEIDLSDYCNITTTCNLSTGNITFVNTGYVLFNATLTANKISWKDSVAVVEKYNLGSNFMGWIG